MERVAIVTHVSCHAHTRLVRAALIGILLMSRVSAAEEQPGDSTAPMTDAAPAIVCLRTEYLPLAKEEKGLLPFRIVRELGRQAVLIAARDGLGRATRDETLGEPFPQAVLDERKELNVKVRCYFDGTIHIDLAPASSANNEDSAAAFQPPEQPDSYDTFTIITSLTEKLEALSRGELVTRLRDLGVSGEPAAVNEDNRPPDTVDALLLEMNFVSQFAALRAAHSAIAEQGQSNAWLGVLARAYANLALMTQHHWKSNNEAFAARALLYAERMVQASDKDIPSRATRAYVWAIVGLHGAALGELAEIQPLPQAGQSTPALPPWFELIGPYCSFERQPLLDVSARRASVRQLAERLSRVRR